MTGGNRIVLASLVAVLVAPAVGSAQTPEAKSAPASAIEQVKPKAKAAGKKGVKKGATKGATKVKPVVGEPAATAGEGIANERGGAAVDQGVDKAAEQVQKMVK